MNEIATAFAHAFRLIVELDAELVEIVVRSLGISLSAVAIAGAIGMPFGALVAITRFPGRQALIILLNALMGLPPVVVGVVLYLVLSRSGPLGTFGLLFSPTAMVIAQTTLITPIVAALSRQIIADLYEEYRELLRSLGISTRRSIWTLIWDGRLSLVTALLAGFGRASGEVGAVLIVGGNIDHVTRVMTTAIALETSKGDLGLAVGLGIIVLALSIGINAAAVMTGQAARRIQG